MTGCGRIILVAAIVSMLPTASFAQSFQERLEHVKRQRTTQRKAKAGQSKRTDEFSIKTRMNSLLRRAHLDNYAAKDAFAWWSKQSGIPLVIDWQSLELLGVDPTKTVDIKLEYVPVGKLLDLLIKQTATDVELMYDTTTWYVKVMTKEEANRKTVIRIYDINDLLLQIPTFTNAPEFDLESALEQGANRGSGGQSGGGGSGSGRSLFNTDRNDREDTDSSLNKEDRGEEIANLIRTTIEPEIWQFNGGEHASIKYFHGKLIINAPKYVQQRIGVPFTSSKPSRSAGKARPNRPTTARPSKHSPTRHRGVAGISE